MAKRDQFIDDGEHVLCIRGEQVTTASKVNNSSSPVTKLPSVVQSRQGKRIHRERSATQLKTTKGYNYLEPTPMS